MSEKRLWLVTVIVEMPVLAATEEEARVLGRRHWRDEVDADADAVHAAPMTRIPAGWDHCVPWAEDSDERTVGQWMNEMEGDR